MSIETGLTGRVVLVTGAAAGIGRATAKRFAAEGAKVVGWDVTDLTEVGEPWRQEMTAAGAASAGFSVVDVRDAAAIAAATSDLVAVEGQIDVLINNAGITRDAQLLKRQDGKVLPALSEAAWDAVIDVNLKGVFQTTQAVAAQMAEAGSGVILSASSVVGLYGNFGQTNYAATKSGVIAMTRTWARELGRFGIRVNAIAPGFVATEMVMAMPEKIRHRVAASTPLGSLGTPEDIAEAYLWLASDAARFVHGAVLSVDGGLVLGT